MHKVYIDKIDFAMHKGKIEKLIDMLMCDAKDNNYGLYEHIEGELYEMAYGKEISEDVAMTWVKRMEPVGLHWDMEETTNAMYQLGYNCKKIDFFVVANMIYNDYHEIVKNDDELALKMAHDWLTDKDAKEDKLYNYWKYVVKRD